MITNKIVYSIKEIFDKNSDNSILSIYDADNYSIPSYQRGFKWSSKDSDSPVQKLMTDLFSAYDSESKKKEYLLQFITVSKKNNKKVLEVIDGQQRLTTLAILLSVIKEILTPSQASIAKDSLSYEIREVVKDFLDKYIYSNINTLINSEWDEIKKNEDYNEQDIWYIVMAAICINNLMKNKFKDDLKEYEKFSNFVLDDVKILLNYIPVTISAEEVFSNVNNNKVPLTNADLIKGLFLTYSARDKENNATYREKQEIRGKMGRQWDNISHWVNRGEIERFYFSNHIFNRSDSLESFLLAFALKENFNYSGTEKKNDVFNYFEDLIKKNPSVAANYYKKLIDLKLILNEWYNNKDIHSKLGYLFSLKSNRNYTINNYIHSINTPKPDIINDLKKAILEILKDIKLSELRYNSDNYIIHDVLLALNVFDNKDSIYFFQQFNKNEWSLEHIFPQNPDDLQTPLRIKDLDLIHSLINNDVFENFETFKDKLKSLNIENLENIYYTIKDKFLKNSLEYNKDEVKILYLLMKTDQLDSIGNMALLTRKLNSSLGNGMFDSKRERIVEKISEGHFVPKHTYDVFSKLFSSSVNKDLITWNDQDIKAHMEYIESKIKCIKENL